MVIKGAMICDANREQRGDIRIESGKITKVGLNILPLSGEEVLTAEGLVLMPTAIDLNVRVQDNLLNKENLLKLSRKAAKGGVGLAILMPDSKHLLNTEMGMDIINTLNNDFSAKIFGAAGIKNHESDLAQSQLPPLSILHKKGAAGIYLQSSENGNLIHKACEFSLMFDTPVFFDCEDTSLNMGGVMNDGELAFKLGLPGISSLSQIKEVAMLSELACFMNLKAIFNAISSYRSLEILQNAKKRNPNIFTQVSIHHLLLTEMLCSHYNTAAKIKPPLKSEKTRIKLVKSIKAMEIDLITSLQSEVSLIYKDLPFEEAGFGVDMIEYFVPMCYTLLVKDERMTLKEMSKILSLNPAKVLKVDNTKGLITEGYDADLLLLDTKKSQIIDIPNSPFYDWVFHGKIKQIFIGG
ncbi:MAG: amidohydrolase family protein, partial [Helicobacter sp.]|nr:amidohydrolase family protein [Helicobacter sp.]